MRALVVAAAVAMLAVPAAHAQPLDALGGQLRAAADVAKNSYSTRVSKQTLTANTLEFDEDILFNNVRVGGVVFIVQFLQPDGQKLAGVTVISNVGDATHLQQEVDLLYGGVAFARLSVSAAPDPDIGHSFSIATRAYDVPQPPLVMTTNTIP